MVRSNACLNLYPRLHFALEAYSCRRIVNSEPSADLRVSMQCAPFCAALPDACNGNQNDLYCDWETYADEYLESMRFSLRAKTSSRTCEIKGWWEAKLRE